MTIITNLATERARRETDRVLDAVDQIRAELEITSTDESSTRLRSLADRLAYAGITMLAATAVMAEDFDRRLQSMGRKAEPRNRNSLTSPDGDQRSML